MGRESFASDQFSPPSSERNRPPFSASISAKMRCEFDGATSTAILPQGFAGRPLGFASPPPLRSGFAKDVQVSPPSRETERSEPGPPLVISHGRRRACQKPAKMTRGLFGSIQTSLAPVSSFLKSTRFHDL